MAIRSQRVVQEYARSHTTQDVHLLDNHSRGMQDAVVLPTPNLPSLHCEPSSDHIQGVGCCHAYDAGTRS